MWSRVLGVRSFGNVTQVPPTDNFTPYLSWHIQVDSSGFHLCTPLQTSGKIMNLNLQKKNLILEYCFRVQENFVGILNRELQDLQTVF